MAQVLTSTNNLNYHEWLEARKKGIGGSDIAAILGLNKYKSPIKLYMEKTGEAPDEEVYTVDENGAFVSGSEAAYWGNVQEEVVAQEFARRTGLKVRRRNAILQHEEHPFFLANVDRLIVGRKEGLECKTASEYLKSAWNEEQVPDAYFVQCQWYMNITGFKKWHLAVLIGGNKFRYFEVDRDDELIEIMNEKALEFWNEHVLKRIPPAFDGSQASSDLLSVMYPESVEGSIDLPGYLGEKLQKFDELKAQIDELTEIKKTIENEIKGHLGEVETGFIGDRKISWKSYKSTRLDSKKLKKEMPEVFDKYAKETTARRFTIK